MSVAGAPPPNSIPAARPVEVRREPEVNVLFRMVMKHQGSDLHLKVGLPPMMRLRGLIRQMERQPLTEEEMERLIYPTLTERQRHILEETGGVDYAHVVGQEEGPFPGESIQAAGTPGTRRAPR